MMNLHWQLLLLPQMLVQRLATNLAVNAKVILLTIVLSAMLDTTSLVPPVVHFVLLDMAQ